MAETLPLSAIRVDAGEWSPERCQLLASLWGAGLPAAEIGARIGATKDAITHRARQLGLARRKSGFRYDLAGERSAHPGRGEA